MGCCRVWKQSSNNEERCTRTSALGEEKRSIFGLIVFLRGREGFILNTRRSEWTFSTQSTTNHCVLVNKVISLLFNMLKNLPKKSQSVDCRIGETLAVWLCNSSD